MTKELILCYVEDSWAYFTTQALEEQWGDDWNDAPYEHNAEEPYKFNEYDAKQGKEPWQIMKVAYQVKLETPSEWERNSPYSVQDINRKATPWLQSGKYGVKDEQGNSIQIWAGCTIDEFVKLIELAKGDVYLKFTPSD